MPTWSPINLAFNAIPAAVSYKLVGKRFTMYSCLHIVLTSIFTDMMPALDITEDILLICIFGGIINGFALSLCLGVRVTSGGTAGTRRCTPCCSSMPPPR